MTAFSYRSAILLFQFSFTIALLLFYIKDIINVSTEPDLNQRPKDICCISLYSPPLYQLSYRW